MAAGDGKLQKWINKIESLVLTLDAHTTVHSSDIDDDDFENIDKLISDSDNLFFIFGHPLFKNSTLLFDLHTKVFQIIIQNSSDPIRFGSIYSLMSELNENANFKRSLTRDYQRSLIWRQTFRRLKSTLYPDSLSSLSQSQKSENRQQTNQPMNAYAAHPRFHVETESDDDSVSSSYHYSDDDDVHLNEVKRSQPSSDESSSCPNMEENESPKTNNGSPTKPPIKEGLYGSIDSNMSTTNDEKQKPKRRRKRKRKSAKSKNEHEPDSKMENESENIEIKLPNLRKYSHDFEEFDSISSSSASLIDPSQNSKKPIPLPPEPKVPKNKKACTICTFHNPKNAKKCQMCGNKFEPIIVEKIAMQMPPMQSENGNKSEKKKKSRNRKPRQWTCSKCGKKNKNLTRVCICGNSKSLKEFEWQCAVCTTVNHANLQKCSACTEPRRIANDGWQCLKCYKINTKSSAKCSGCHQAKRSLNVSPKRQKKKRKKKNVIMHSQLSYNQSYNDNQSEKKHFDDRRRGYHQSNARKYEPKRSRVSKNVQIALNNQEQFKRNHHRRPPQMRPQHASPHPQRYNDDCSSSHHSMSNVAPSHYSQPVQPRRVQMDERKYNINDIVWYKGWKCKIVLIDGSNATSWLYTVQRLGDKYEEYTRANRLTPYGPQPPSFDHGDDDDAFYGPQRNHSTQPPIQISLNSLFG